MGRKKKLPRIEVHTVPNGYTLTIEGHRNEYMYFSPEKLMEGVMVHIGLKMTDQLSAETIQSFIDSALQWNDLKKSTAEINRLKALLKAQQTKYNGLARKLVKERDRLMLLIDRAKEVAVGKSLTDNITRLNRTIANYGPLKTITYSELGITSEMIDEDEETEDPATDGE
jgi:hypothetical protein